MSAAPRVCPAIVGPTAVGKTGLITRLARNHPLEVISLDSRQIYRGLRIGTAQPSAEELAVRAAHHGARLRQAAKDRLHFRRVRRGPRGRRGDRGARTRR